MKTDGLFLIRNKNALLDAKTKNIFKGPNDKLKFISWNFANGWTLVFHKFIPIFEPQK